MLKNASKRVSLHMPGTQGYSPFSRINPYRLDTTEIACTDDLYHPFSAIIDAETAISKEAHSAHTIMLTGGSTAGIHAMLRYTFNPGDTVIFSRNVHISAIHSAINFSLNVVFLPHDITSPNSFSLSSVEKTIRSHPEAKGLLVVRPDYFGNSPDLSPVITLCHEKGLLVLVDEAHGAHFNWLSTPASAVALGADLVVQSAHKTLPALTGCAWLHSSDAIDSERLRYCLRMVQTSSPPFLLLMSLDDARAYMQYKGVPALNKLSKAIIEFESKAGQLGYPSAKPTDIPTDPVRVVLHAPQGGFLLMEQLASQGLDVEMADETRIVCILSLMDGAKRLKRLFHALKRIPPTANTVLPLPPPPEITPIRSYPLAKAAFLPCESVPLEESLDRIVASQIGLYPPGIALLSAGEVMNKPLLSYLQALPPERIFGLNNNCIKVVVKEFNHESISL